ncbi:hypothetical protein E2C01_058791 [Portunus trituberculatus]|uniref:Uncharacterized protein n=1 Tax=Portunus trituberculatus TaxID=210409 RepID=A0A5B7GWH6_PORTR|nr:hypothetical protein [Portunus trituberculatus]
MKSFGRYGGSERGFNIYLQSHTSLFISNTSARESQQTKGLFCGINPTPQHAIPRLSLPLAILGNYPFHSITHYPTFSRPYLTTSPLTDAPPLRHTNSSRYINNNIGNNK